MYRRVNPTGMLTRLECNVSAAGLHVAYAERRKKYSILFIFSLFCDYTSLEYVRIHVIYRVSQSEYVIRLLVAAPQEYLNIYSTHRAAGHL